MRLINTSFRLTNSIFKVGNLSLSAPIVGQVYRAVTVNTLDALEYQKVDGTLETVNLAQDVPQYILAVSGSIPDNTQAGAFSTVTVTNLLITSSVDDFVFTEQLITTVGSGTWTKPVGVTQVIVECWGGGGAGGGSTINGTTGGGGGGGQYSRKLVTYDLSQSSKSYSVGSSTAGGTGIGATGSSTTWETNVVIAVGGTGGDVGGTVDQPAPGGIGNRSGSIGDVIYFGADGTAGSATFPDFVPFGGDGGAGAGSGGKTVELSDFKEYGGIGGIGAANSSANGNPGENYGGGGGGAVKVSGANRSGGSGAQGLIRLIYPVVPQLSVDPQNSLSYPGSGTSWYDLSFNNFTGSLFNSPTYTSTPPANFSFNGTNQYAIFPYSGSATSNFTLTAWVKIPTTGGRSFLSRGRDFSGDGWSLYLGTDSNTKPVFGVVTTAPSTVSSIISGSSAIITNEWYFLVGVWTGGVSQALYVNSVLETSGNNTGTSLRSSTEGIAVASLSTIGFFDMSIGNFKVYSDALTEQQIIRLYNNELNRYV